MLLNEFRNHFIDSLIEDYPKTEIIAFFRRLTDFYFQWPPTFCALNTDYTLSQLELDVLSNALEELKVHSPLQYITHEAHFYNRSFYVDQNVLIPRPETEDLVHWVLSDFDHFEGSLDVLEVGTGSGCIAVSLAKENSNFNIEALEISRNAIAVAQKNAVFHKVEVNFIQQDMRVLEVWRKPLDVIISNPPYIEPGEKKEMLPNVLNHEPHLALFTPEKDPLYYYKKIIVMAESSLKIRGSLYFEVNPIFLDELMTFIKAKTFEDIEVRNDIFGKQRMLKALKS
jgi:release factor glutamine methyltransferase